MDQKKLVRPKEGRVLFGVCQGIANYFNIDPIVVRIVFIVLTIWGGAGIILYIIGIFLIPEEKTTRDKVKAAKEDIQGRVEAVASDIKASFRHDERRLKGEQIFGLIVLLVGLIFLFQNFFSWLNFGRLWPLILVLLGVIILVQRRGR